MNVLDLFSGIGGFGLGLERAGMRVVAFCESDRYCRAVLAEHWPDVRCYDDVRSLTGERLHADGIAVDVITGGFPCQDVSVAGTGAGLDGERSGLWSQYARIVGEVRPRYVLIENVSALLGRGLVRILGELAALGYHAEWRCLRACDFGALHIRDRVFIVAYPSSDQLRQQPGRRDGTRGPGAAEPGHHGAPGPAADTNGRRCESLWLTQHGEQQRASWHEPDGLRAPGWRDGPAAADAGLPRSPQRRWILASVQQGTAAATHDWRLTEPAVCRAADGIPHRVDRIKTLGNAVVPQIVEAIGRAIMTAE